MSATHRPPRISTDVEEALACRLDAADQASLMADYGLLARTAVSGVRRAGSTLEFSVSRSHETEALVERIVQAERVCCPFMDVLVERDGGSLVLTYSGPDAVEPVLDMIEARVQAAA